MFFWGGFFSLWGRVRGGEGRHGGLMMEMMFFCSRLSLCWGGEGGEDGMMGLI